MIIGTLIEALSQKGTRMFISSNSHPDDLYKDGLQREQFIPFINIMKKMCYEETLIIKEDYRKSKKNNITRYFYPLNESNIIGMGILPLQFTNGVNRKNLKAE